MYYLSRMALTASKAITSNGLKGRTHGTSENRAQFIDCYSKRKKCGGALRRSEKFF